MRREGEYFFVCPPSQRKILKILLKEKYFLLF
jgi:hypothetical protein